LFVALVFFLLLTSGGQASGCGQGALRRRLRREGVYRSDRVGGAVVRLLLGVLVAVWLLIRRWRSAARLAGARQDSQVVRAINRYAPDPPPQAQRLGRAVADGPFPEVFSRLNGPGGVGAPPTRALPPDVASRVSASVLRIEGEACDQIQAGSGFVAGPNLVVTNAHVVAGEPRTEVDTNDGRRLSATVVAFDPERDLAVFRVRNLRLFALPFADGSDGTTGAVFGHPGGGLLRIAPARIAETVQRERHRHLPDRSHEPPRARARRQSRPGRLGRSARGSAGPDGGGRIRRRPGSGVHGVRIDETRGRQRSRPRARRPDIGRHRSVPRRLTGGKRRPHQI
jgi:hypothetical protein